MTFLAAVITLNSRQNRQENLGNALSWTKKACQAGARWIVLPEMMSFHGPYDQLKSNAGDESLLQDFAALSREFAATIFCGSIPETSGGDKVFNTQYVFSAGGLLHKYRKRHLFNLLSPDGKKLYCESDGFLAGEDLVTFNHEGLRVALATCYDLRFQEMFLEASRSAPIDVIVAPSAFTDETGKSHWELLVRARAVDNLCYVIAPNQVGEHSPGKKSFGHSMIVGPWGDKLCDTGADVGMALAFVDAQKVAEVRSRLPVLKNRLYRL